MKKSTNRVSKAVKKLPIKPFPIVGFGASAGGIEAFTKLLKHLDTDLGMAYVLIMHLSPHHKSALAEIVQSKTRMPVHTVKNGMEVKANHIFVIPPNTFMSVVDGHLKLAPRSFTTIGNFAVDYFFTGLASVYKNNAIGVILSGTATDGTLGLKAIKTEGGITFAQDDTAEFTGMPHSAYESGCVDFLLPPEGIARELGRLGRLPYTLLPSKKIEKKQEKEITHHQDQIKTILALVHQKTGIDFFSNYKQASVYRRVMRRMALSKLENLKEYHSFLVANPAEVSALYNDFLINVTHFFRDPEFYKILEKEVFPIISKVKPLEPIRIWVAGCATGEEAYSIAICLLDFLERKSLTLPIQIFASDLDIQAIEKARLGIYSVSSLVGVSQQQLKRYFRKKDGFYQIVKAVRELCVFSHHNLLKDPPFSRMDLISCQNVMIYLENAPQKKILQTFHFALKPSGFLFLGKSESIGTSTELFEPIAKKIRLYTRKPASSPQLEFTVRAHGNGLPRPTERIEMPQTLEIEKDLRQYMLTYYVQPCVVVNKGMKIIQFFGNTSPYLSPLSGKASLNILKMVREDLALDLVSLLQLARKTEKPAIREGIRFNHEKNLYDITLDVIPRKISEELFYLVIFRKNGFVESPKAEKGIRPKGDKAQKQKIERLEHELSESRGLIRSTSEEYETTYEELQANNEEILSSNEELQSVNEELETSKEELQSSNEELTTTNEELSKRNTELSDSQKELKRVNEQLEQFAFISGHDLQEPLRKIEIFSDFLSSPQANLNEYARNYSNKINASASRMSALIKDLLSYSVLGKQDLRKPVKVDLNVVIKNILEDFEVIVEAKKAIITVATLPVIYGEPAQMNQLFYNLLSNALKFDKEKPIIDISFRESVPADLKQYPELLKDAPYTVISIADQGIGFDQKYATKLFSLFQRLQDKKDEPGTGIGLSICKKIVENHNGFIFANGKVNEGAVFTVFLPTFPLS